MNSLKLFKIVISIQEKKLI